ncbi:MAG: hypothetical protein IKH46_04390 [Lachnospiraceae bacterium]|nr:hypothetical protein [Lachnospiraceae bacterium]
MQDAWLTFFSSVKVEDILKLIDMFPEFRDYYRDIAKYRRKPEEVIHMYSEAIAFLDHNTEQYMIEDMTNQLNALKKEKAELEKETADLAEKKSKLEKEKKNWDAERQDWDAQRQDWDAERQNLNAQRQDLEAENKRLAEEIARLKELYEATTNP